MSSVWWRNFGLWFLLIYGPVLDVGLGSFADVSFFVCACLALRFFRARPRVLELRMMVSLLAVFFLANATYIFAEGATYNAGLHGVFRPIRALIMFAGTIAMVDYTMQTLMDRGQTRREAIGSGIWIIYLCIVLHGAIMVLQFMVPPFREAIYSFTYAKHQLDFYQHFRMAGLSGAGGAQISVVQSLGFAIGIYLYTLGRGRELIVLANLLLIGSILLSGRSGLLTVALCIPFLIVLMLSGGNRRSFDLSDARSLLFLFFVPSISVFAMGYLSGNDYMETVILRTFDTFFRFQQVGVVEDDTLIALSRMLHIPQDFWHLVLGRASYIMTNTFYDIDTDIGYLQLIWAYGLVGLTLHLIFYLGFFRMSQMIFRYDRGLAIASLFMLAIIIFFNAKEVFFLTRMSFPIMAGFVMFARHIRLDSQDSLPAKPQRLPTAQPQLP